MGMARAIGRSSDEEMPLISYLLSVHRDLQVEATDNLRSQDTQHRRSFNAFRPILPRTMSTLVLSQGDLPSPTSTSPSILLDAPDFPTRERSPSPLEAWGQGKEGAGDDQGDPADLHFNKARTGVVMSVARLLGPIKQSICCFETGAPCRDCFHLERCL